MAREMLVGPDDPLYTPLMRLPDKESFGCAEVGVSERPSLRVDHSLLERIQRNSLCFVLEEALIADGVFCEPLRTYSALAVSVAPVVVMVLLVALALLYI